MTGEHVRLYPYVRGHWPPETLYALWKLLMPDQDTAKNIFFGRSVLGPPTPYPTLGDLVEFVRFFDPDPPGQRRLLIAESLRTPGEVVGLFWFDDLVPGHRAAGNVLYRRRFWGAPAREASRLALAWGFAELGVRAIWAYTPWRVAVKHCEAVGLRLVATLPEFVELDGVPQDMHILRVRKEEFANG